MFTHFTIRLTGPICSCRAENLSWDFTPESALIVACATCAAKVEVPRDSAHAAVMHAKDHVDGSKHVPEGMWKAVCGQFCGLHLWLDETLCACEKPDRYWSAHRVKDESGTLLSLRIWCKACEKSIAVPNAKFVAKFALKEPYPGPLRASGIEVKKPVEAEKKPEVPPPNFVPVTSDITFADVAGIEVAIEKSRQLVRFLKDPERYTRLKAKMPRGYLFTGEPGTGKTLLARAIAGEAGVPFFALSGSGFIEKYVGVGASRIRELFAEARKAAPCIIFIDEIDGLCVRRSADSGGATEYATTLNQLLIEMDGFAPNSGIVVVGATNRPELIDEAAMRPGRFTRKIAVPMPDLDGRRMIIAVHARGMPMANDVDLDALAGDTEGMSGADLADLLNEGAINAAEHEKDAVEQSDIAHGRVQVVEGKIAEGKKRRVGFGA